MSKITQIMGFLCGSAGKESACNAGDLGSTPGLGRSFGEEKGYTLQYCRLENSRDCSQTRLSDFHSDNVSSCLIFFDGFPHPWNKINLNSLARPSMIRTSSPEMCVPPPPHPILWFYNMELLPNLLTHCPCSLSHLQALASFLGRCP